MRPPMIAVWLFDNDNRVDRPLTTLCGGVHHCGGGLELASESNRILAIRALEACKCLKITQWAARIALKRPISAMRWFQL
jgi:hypothetical protein